MSDKRILGVMPIWAREDFVLPALEQALTLVDQLAVSVCCLHPYLEKFEDSSRSIVEDFAAKNPDRVTFVAKPDIPPRNPLNDRPAWSERMSHLLNCLLSHLNPQDNDLVWLLDVDEFYTGEAVEEIFDWISENKNFTSLRFASRFFGPDFTHYIKHGHTRLYRHWPGRKFIPTSYYSSVDKSSEVTILEENPMFHYSLMVPWEMKYDFWEVETGLPVSRPQLSKARWVTNQYFMWKLDGDNTNVIAYNKKLTGHAGFWFSDNVVEDAGGVPFVYNGKHPGHVEKFGLPEKIGDARKYFRFFQVRIPLKQLRGKRGLVGAEIGVDQGHHAYAILNELDIAKLFLIDPYSRYSDKIKASQARLTDRFHTSVKFLSRYNKKVAWLRMQSSQAAALIADNSLDFVYIDGSHERDLVKQDFELYYDKVKPGGLVAGHDYTLHEANNQVVSAVNEFAAAKGLKVFSGGRNNAWMFKPVEVQQIVIESDQTIEDVKSEPVNPAETTPFVPKVQQHVFANTGAGNLRTPFFPLVGKKQLIGVEVGVERGLHAEALLKNLDVKTLFLVDPYKAYVDRGGGFAQFVVDKWRAEAIERLASYSDRLIWLPLKSLDAAQLFADGMMDFVYLDGCHIPEAVAADLLAWFTKVKPGGLFAGHDYYQDEPGLCDAVTTFAQQHLLSLTIDGGSPPEMSNWWSIVGESVTQIEEPVAPEPEPDIQAGDATLVAGPFLGEFGYELMLWIPTVRAMSRQFAHTIVLAHSSMAHLYSDFADTIVQHTLSVADKYTFNTREHPSFWAAKEAWMKDAGISDLDEVTRLQDEAISPQTPESVCIESGQWILGDAPKEYKRY